MQITLGDEPYYPVNDEKNGKLYSLTVDQCDRCIYLAFSFKDIFKRKVSFQSLFGRVVIVCVFLIFKKYCCKKYGKRNFQIITLGGWRNGHGVFDGSAV